LAIRASQPCEPCQPNAKTSRTRQMLAVSSTLAFEKSHVPSSKRAAIPPQKLKSTRNMGIYTVHQQAQALVSPIITRSRPTAPHSALKPSELERSQVQVAQRLLRRRTQPHEPSPSPSFAALPARLSSKTHKTAQIERSVMKADRFAGRVPL
jgi:hypothetical protein